MSLRVSRRPWQMTLSFKCMLQRGPAVTKPLMLRHAKANLGFYMLLRPPRPGIRMCTTVLHLLADSTSTELVVVPQYPPVALGLMTFQWLQSSNVTVTTCPASPSTLSSSTTGYSSYSKPAVQILDELDPLSFLTNPPQMPLCKPLWEKSARLATLEGIGHGNNSYAAAKDTQNCKLLALDGNT